MQIPPPQVVEATAAELQTAIAEGTATRRGIVQAHLDRIALVNPTTNSFVELRAEEALAEAERADERLGRELGGPLDGVPLSIKDSYSVAGLHRTDGLPANADVVDAADELVTERLRGAGGLILGHAGIPDLCIRWNSISGLYGAVRNPRDPERTAGGSSGGDAANVAAGLATLGLGGDLGGSVRVPASWCGVYGLRSGPGRIPAVNPNPSLPPAVSSELMYQIGPIGRSVDDVERAFRVLSGFDHRDPMSAPLGLPEPGPLEQVAVLRHEAGAVLDPDVEAELDATIEILRSAGYTVAEHVLPDLRRAPEVWAEILGTELIHGLLPTVDGLVIDSEREHILDMFGAFELGTDVTATLAAWDERRALQQLVLDLSVEYGLILSTVAGMAAPPLDFDDHLGRDASIALFDRMRNVPWVNLFGLPALALPNGIQIVGRRYEELGVLRAGRAFEAAVPRVRVSPPVG